MKQIAFNAAELESGDDPTICQIDIVDGTRVARAFITVRKTNKGVRYTLTTMTHSGQCEKAAVANYKECRHDPVLVRQPDYGDWQFVEQVGERYYWSCQVEGKTIYNCTNHAIDPPWTFGERSGYYNLGALKQLKGDK